MRKTLREIHWSLLVFIALMLYAQSALADVRTEARKHFRAGMELISGGQLDEGAAELETAYELMPHPNVLYNLAQAYFDAGNYVQTILYFERYLESDPPDTTQVEILVGALRDKLAVQNAQASAAATEEDATLPEGTEVTVTNSVLQVISQASARFSAIAEATQSETLQQEAATLDELARTLVAQPSGPSPGDTEWTTPGSTPPSDPAAATEATADQAPPPPPPPMPALEMGGQRTEDIYQERVVSASRLAQSPLDAPNSTVVVTEQDIRLTGITNLGELLRRVAGVELMTLTPGDSQLSIRGLNQRLSNKVLVLIDGRSVFLDFLAATLWTVIPIALEDIERIEVIRGPASALYGADAFSGVINILLKKPGMGDTLVTAAAGDGRSVRAAARFSGRSEAAAYRFSAGHIQSDHFSYGVSPDRVDLAQDSGDDQVGLLARWFNTDFSIKMGEGYTARVGTATMNGDFSFLSSGRLRNLQARNAFLAQTHANLSTPIGVTLRTFWNAFSSNVNNPEARRSDVNVDFEDLVSHVVDVEAEFDHSFDFIVPQNINIGLGYRFKSIDWDWLDKDHTENHTSAFLQDTLELGSLLRATASLRVDKHPLITVPVLSPRGALVLRVSEFSAIRATIASAFRSPAFLESYLSNRVPTPLRGVTALGIGDETISPEEIVSYEIGYTHQGSDSFAIEANVYINEVSQLIRFSQISSYSLTDFPGYNDEVNAFPVGFLQFTNEDATYRQMGGEFGLRFFPVTGLDLYLNYALHDTAPQGDTSSLGDRLEEQRTSAHKINGGIQYRSRFGLDLAVDVHFVSDQVWVQEVASAESGSATAIFEVPAYTLLSARLGYRLADDHIELGLTGSNLLGRPIRQHPFGETIPRRLHGSVTVRF